MTQEFIMIIVKIFVITLLILHLVFSFVLTRQTKLMIKVVEARVTPTIYAISVIHLLASLFITIWALLFL